MKVNNLKKSKKIVQTNKFIIILSFIILNLYIGIKFSRKIIYQDNFIRLHIVANSNSISDQIEKLKISEKINSYINTLNISSITSKEEILSILNSKANEILKIANENTNYNTTLQIGKIKYEEKQNLTYDMPSGTYNSVKLILGKGDGKNIWSFIFPNEENIENIKNLETILPGISNIYENTDFDKSTYSIKSVEMFKSIIKNCIIKVPSKI